MRLPMVAPVRPKMVSTGKEEKEQQRILRNSPNRDRQRLNVN